MLFNRTISCHVTPPLYPVTGDVKVAAGIRARVLRQDEHVCGRAVVAERGARRLQHQTRHHLPHRRAQREGLRARHASQVVARYVIGSLCTLCLLLAPLNIAK